MPRRGSPRVVAAILGIALAVRLAAAIASFGAPLAFDPADYDRHARSIASGHGYPEAVHPRDGPSALRPPAFPFLLAGVYAISGSVDPPPGWRTNFAPGYKPASRQVDAGRILEALVGTAIVALIGLVAWQLWGRRVGLVSMAIAAVYPPLIVLGLTLLSDPLFVALELGALAAALRARERTRARLRWAAAAGALAGLAWLTRSNGYVLLPPLAVLVWTARPRVSWRALAAPAVVALAALVVVAPWAARNASAMDAFVPVSDNGGYTLAGTYNDTARHDSHYLGGWRPAQTDPRYGRLLAASSGELDASRTLGREARRYALAHPAYVAEVGLCNTLRLAFLGWVACGDSRASATVGYTGEEGVSQGVALVAIVSFALIALLALRGVFTAAARRVPMAVWGIPVLLWAAVFVLAANRFRAPLEPYLIMLAALALVRPQPE